MSTRTDPKDRLRQLYGFDFPDDLFAFWDFARRLRPLEPLLAFAEELSLHLVGPFEVLAGRFDNHSPRLPLTLHWRYHDDPPEFFTVLAGRDNGFHHGYFLDEPGSPESCVASYCTRAAFEISPDGDSLFEVLRLELERLERDCDDLQRTSQSSSFECERKQEEIAALRNRLPQFSVHDRPEIGADYEERYPERSARSARVVAATREGMGIVVPAGAYRPLTWKDRMLWRRLRQEDNLIEIVNQARSALAEGYPGTALKLGKDLLAIGGKRESKYASELLDGAYTALGRDTLRDVLRAHQAHRDLPGVDILEYEAGLPDE